MFILFNAHQLPDGANAMLIGQLSEDEAPMALVGGNCAIQGFDHEGQDKFWTVSSGTWFGLGFFRVM